MSISSQVSLKKNLWGLVLIQGASYLAPLFMLPFLSRTLGLDAFGIAFFGISVVIFAGVVVDFGFDLYASYYIAKRREDQPFVNRIAGAIFTVKLGLFMVLSVIFCLWAFLSNTYTPEFILSLLFPIGALAFQPNWLFLAIESMQEITVYFIVSRIAYIFLVLFTVTSPEDSLLVILCLGASYGINSFLSLRKMTKVGVVPIAPTLPEIRETLSGSFGFFLARSSSAFYSGGGTIFLGLVVSGAQLGYFTSAEQLFRGLQGMFSPVAQALFPFMSRTQNRKIFVLMFFAVLCLGAITLILALAVAEPLIKLLYGSGFEESASPFLVFLLVLALNIPSTLLGYPLLGSMGYSSYVNFTVMVGCGAQIALLSSIYLAGLASALSVAACIAQVEFLILSMRVAKLLSVSRECPHK